MAYSFDQVFAADPSNPSNVAQNAAITIFAVGDGTMTPLTITDPDGQPLANPITVNANGFASAFAHATLDRVAWAGGGFTGFFTSYEGMKNEAAAARVAAESAAATAGADAAAVAAVAIGTASEDASAAATAAENAEAAAAASASAAASAAALVGAPADAAIAAAITGSGTATKTALNAYAPATGSSAYAAKAAETTAAAAITLATSGKPSPKAAVSSMISALQTGHGWTVITPASSNLNNTADFALGTQSAYITSNGTGGQMSLDKTGLTVDATGKFIRLWLKVDDLSKLNYIQLYLGDSTLANNYNGQIVNGTAAWRNTQSVVRSGEWTVLDVPFTDLTSVTGSPSRAAITRARVTVLDRSTGPVTVSLNGLALVSEQTTYPNGVVSLTFDDNPAAQYTIARPYMDKYGYSGTLYPVIDQVDQPGQMTLAQMKALQDFNGWDFGAHASTMAQHVAGFQGRTEAELVAEYETIRAWMRTNGLRGESFAWPNGDSDLLAETVCSRYFRSARTVYNRTHEVIPPMNPFRLRAVNPTNMTLTQMQAEVAAAKAGKYWLNFIFHDIKTTKSQQNDVATADFQGLVDYINAQAVPVRTVSQVLATAG